MSKLKEKVPCDYCKKKIHAREKTKVVGALELHYLWCATCKTVYPSYIHNDETRDITKEIERKRHEIFKSKECQFDPDMIIKSNARLYKDIMNLQKQNVIVTKRLVKTHINLFEGIGERVIYK